MHIRELAIVTDFFLRKTRIVLCATLIWRTSKDFKRNVCRLILQQSEDCIKSVLRKQKM